MDKKFDDTMKFNIQKETVQSPKEILNKVCEALEAKGYNPIYMDFMKKNLDDIEVVYVDERLTTVSATRVLIDTNVRRENRKKYVDSIAANYILRTYLDMQRGKNGE